MMSDFGGSFLIPLTPQALTPLMSDFYLLFNVQLFEVILAPKMHVLIDDFCKRCFKKTICYTKHEKMQLNIFDAKKTRQDIGYLVLFLPLHNSYA